MPYPPHIPPATRTNSTAMASNHPTDHNDISSALTDIINELGNNPSGPQGTLQARVAANETNKLARDGHQAMTGDLDMGGHQVTNMDASPTPGPNTAISKSYADGRYVNVAGDRAITGDLQTDGDVISGARPSNTSTNVGTLMTAEGRFVGTCGDDMVDFSSIGLTRRGGAGAQATGQAYLSFRREASVPDIIGSITIGSGSAVAYNTSSDYRLKTSVGPITDAAARVQQLAAQAFRGTWNADEGAGEEWDMLYAHDVDTVAGYAVTGDKDAVDIDGNILPQQTDYKALVPLLIAALGEALDRIDALETPGP